MDGITARERFSGSVTTVVARLLSCLWILSTAIACTGDNLSESPSPPPTTGVAADHIAPSSPPDGLRQLTDAPGLEAMPSFAPDGGSLAFCSDRDGGFEIYVRDLDERAEERQLTSDAQQNLQPAYSPDGKLIAYHSSGRGGIWVIPTSGGEPRQLTDFGSAPAWSPDGSTLVFQSDRLAELTLFAYPALPPSTLWLVPLTGGEPRQLTRPGEPEGGHGAPTWSPDGQRIAFTSFTIWTGKLWTVAIDGSDLQRFDHVRLPREPVYSPDGKSLFYSAPDRALGFTLWRLPTTGNAKPEPVRSLAARGQAISPDGKHLVFTQMDLESRLWALPIEPDTGEVTGPPTPLTEDPRMILSRPAVSPDGRSVAAYHKSEANRTELWRLGIDGSGLSVLSDEGTFASGRPMWHPEEQNIRFLSRVEDQVVWKEIDLASRQTSLLAEVDRGWSWARLAPDGQRIAFHRNDEQRRSNVWLVTEPGAEPRQLTNDSESAGFPTWSRNGAFLALELRRGIETHLGTVAATGGDLTQLTTEPGKSSWPSWSPDGEKIVFAAQRDGFWNLFWIAHEGGPEHRLTDLPRKFNLYLRFPDWSPAGDRIVYELGETLGDLWILDL